MNKKNNKTDILTPKPGKNGKPTKLEQENIIKDIKGEQKAKEKKNKKPFEFNHNLVEKALFRRAKGFQYYETTITPGKDKEDEDKTKKVKKTVIPDVSACIFWLKNRLPDKWRDPKDIDNETRSLKDFLEHYYEEE